MPASGRARSRALWLLGRIGYQLRLIYGPYSRWSRAVITVGSQLGLMGKQVIIQVGYPTALIDRLTAKTFCKRRGLRGNIEVYGHKNGIFILIVPVSYWLTPISVKPVAHHHYRC